MSDRCQFDCGGWCLVETELKDYVCPHSIERKYLPPQCNAKTEDLITEEEYYRRLGESANDIE